MSDALAVVAGQLRTALTALTASHGIRHVQQLFGPVDPPCTVLPAPSLRWTAYDDDPTEATFRVALVVPRDDRSVERLLELYPLVAAALRGVEDAALRSADPGAYPAGGIDLPAYLFDVDVSL